MEVVVVEVVVVMLACDVAMVGGFSKGKREKGGSLITWHTICWTAFARCATL